MSGRATRAVEDEVLTFDIGRWYREIKLVTAEE